MTSYMKLGKNIDDCEKQKQELTKLEIIETEPTMSETLEDAHAQYKLGMSYFEGKGAKRDFEKAVYHLKKSAEQGYCGAQYELSQCYNNGIGVEQDDVKATEWLKKAAEQDHLYAMPNLALCYIRGTGVPKDYKQALVWFKKDADEGSLSSMLAVEIISNIPI